ncbi:hypothetical protein SASPL_108465 [Salvia splendens]|uniref:U4/U6.U5 tri-snRNP component SNU23 n=1 Tax=Salvia splendens TaxID=180675 RepID=A0A8X8YI66_SALSN|nr:hypothetical protein SASPL_108465 [Salvia splendens]
MSQSGNGAAGIDNTFRKKFDREEYLQRARDREAKEEARNKSKSSGPPVQRKPLKHRDYEVDLESRLGKTQVVTPIAPLSQQVQQRFEVLKKRKDTPGFTEQDFDERILKQQQEEEERKRQRREKKKEKKKEKAVEEEPEIDPDVAAMMGFGESLTMIVDARFAEALISFRLSCGVIFSSSCPLCYGANLEAKIGTLRAAS